jgi:dipeptidyl aminopeptidase/acylaminoacyl peptidase
LSDIAQRADVETGGYFENEYKIFVGDYKADAELFEQTSPARNAQRVKGPILLTMGSNDKRVPLNHGERMRDALNSAGKNLEYKVYTGEGHGFNKEENVIDFYRRSEQFFSSCLRPLQ